MISLLSKCGHRGGGGRRRVEKEGHTNRYRCNGRATRHGMAIWFRQSMFGAIETRCVGEDVRPRVRAQSSIETAPRIPIRIPRTERRWHAPHVRRSRFLAQYP